ncbi:DUF4236 domain-containing protein [Clostridium felsineum]|uniref:DUF4236 domain-containing protein n=1 Tax=Clostridium felsineum TaxID=36839 RepID=UPI00214D7256|nr:DUF4236 domain-containing protein [Clostridium felsineum]MCR3760424.1 DUF4236 domain-containing protein [Clostridium felsineum]
MGWRVRKSIKLGKNTKLNLNKKSFSVSTGTKGARVTLNNKGKATRTFGIPETGIYNTKQYDLNQNQKVYKNNMKINAINYGSFESLLTLNEMQCLKTPSKIILSVVIGIILAIVGVIFLPCMLLALIFLGYGLFEMVINKDYKFAFKMSIANLNYKKGNIMRARGLVNRALKIKPNHPVALKILELI